MFVCRACARHWRGPPTALFARTGVAQQRQLRPIAASLFSTSTTIRQQQRERQAPNATAGTPIETDLDVGGQDRKNNKSLAPAAKDGQLEKKAKQRLRFLKDVYTIAMAVKETLESKAPDKFEEALTLTRLASKDHDVFVAWNHLIKHLLRADRMTDAIKLYNEMKKRAQNPSAQTYTIIFHGCAKSSHPTQAVAHATRLYQAMMTNERFTPNTIHMNAVLEVCARAKDIDMLLSIASSANQQTRIPDAVTYTIVLNGLRHATVRPHDRPNKLGGGGSANKNRGKDDDEDDAIYIDKEKVSTTISRARTIWEEVITNWRNGTVAVDAGLVNSMGRVLLMGNFLDNDDVLSLVEQTMNIPRFDRRQTNAVEAPEPDEAVAEAETTAETAAETTAEGEVEAAGEADANKITADNVPKPKPPPRVSQFDSKVTDRKGGDLFVKPTPDTLSLILTALGATKKTSSAVDYWNYMMDPSHGFGITPDSENYYRLLKVMRRGHASTATVDALLGMPKDLLLPKTFQLAMGTCLADNLNQHAFANAGKVLDLMLRTLREPDMHTCRLYLQTALKNNRHFRDVKPQMRARVGTLKYGEQLVRALQRLWDPLRRAGNLINFPSAPFKSGEDKFDHQYNQRREVAALARMMVGAADFVVSENMAQEETIKSVRITRNLLNRVVTRFYANREELEPNLNPEGRNKKGKINQKVYEQKKAERKEKEANEQEERWVTAVRKRREELAAQKLEKAARKVRVEAGLDDPNN